MKKFFTIISIILFAAVLNLYAQPVVNGDLSDADYTTIAVKQNSNAGFGSDIDVSKIVYYADASNSMLYLGFVGKLDVTNDNALGVWLNISGSGAPAGLAAGSSLGFSGAGSYMDGDGGSNIDFKADFEVDYMFAFNPGGSNTSVYWDASSHVGGGSVAEYQGSCDQSGTAATNSNAGGGIFTQNSITFAFNNGGGADQGLEMAIPFSELGANSTMSLEAFAFIVSSTGYFSDVTTPGDVTGGNLGNNPDFSTLSGSPYHSSPDVPLPVELTSFNAALQNGKVLLTWETATEINNQRFEIERKADNQNWITAGFKNGHENSSNTNKYNFTDDISDLSASKLSYRLKQIDFNGNYSYSNVINVENSVPDNFALYQNYPNPFNPSTIIKYQIPKENFVSLKIYNSLGQVVANPVNGMVNAGVHQLNFNTSSLSSGIYYYVLKVGQLDNSEFVKTAKMMLIK